MLINQTRLINYLQVCGNDQSWAARDTALVAKDMQAFYKKKKVLECERGPPRCKRERVWENTHHMLKSNTLSCRTVLENAQEKKGENVANAGRNPNL